MAQPGVTITPAQAYPLDRAKVAAMGGAYEGSSRASRELATWSPVIRSADQDLNDDKPILDSRVRDTVRNDGYALGGLSVHRDSIVGGFYRLNARPDWKVLGADETWAEEFQEVVERKFTLWAESSDNWPDASRLNTLTGLVRMVVGLGVLAGEAVATAEWLRDDEERRPLHTAVQMVDVDRLSNPDDGSDTQHLRRGVERNSYGAPQAYHFRMTHPAESYMDGPSMFTWKRVPTRKPWGRLQVIHLYEQLRPDQSRGVSDLVSTLKEMRMTRKFREIVLQNAVVNATYAAAIESEIPSETLWEQMGSGTGDAAIESYLQSLAAYSGGARSLHIDGVKIPHLFPGTKLNLKPMGTPGGVGTEFEQSLLRYVASSLGLSYEQLSRDYTRTNYSSARASLVETWKYMQSRKKMFADRFASIVYALWLEEMVNKGELPLPTGRASGFYDGLNKEAYCKCEWIGASRGQIDEYKEMQAATLRVQGGFSTMDEEIARISGKDYRDVFAQQAREQKLREELGIAPVGGVQPAANASSDGLDESDESDESKRKQAA